MKINFIPLRQLDPATNPTGPGKTEPPAGGVTKEMVMQEFTNIKTALEKDLEKKAEERQKNLDDKLEAVNAAMKALEDKKEATEKELEEMRTDLKAMVKAYEIVEAKVKAKDTKGGEPSEDMSFGGHIMKAFEPLKENAMKGRLGERSDFQIKAVGTMTTLNNLTGTPGAIPNTYRPGIVPVPFDMIHLRDLVAVTPSETDSYHFFRHTVGEGTIGFQKYEDSQKNQFDEDLKEQTVTLDTLAGFMKISKRMLRNFSTLMNYLGRWLPEKYYQSEDTKGYQVLINDATGTGDSSGTYIIDRIVRTIGKQRKAKYNVNGIVVDGEVWAKLLTQKGSGSGEFTVPAGIVTITPTGQLLICGIPVYVASWVGGDEAIIGDFRFFEIIQSESLSVGFYEQDDKNVQYNQITARVEATVGFATLDPAAFVVLALESVS